jgi:hypothetical protein
VCDLTNCVMPHATTTSDELLPGPGSAGIDDKAYNDRCFEIIDYINLRLE